MMRVIVPNAAGEPEMIHQQRPQAGANEVVIKVAYSGMNRADVMQLAGHYPPPAGASEVLGLEVSGWIAEVGAGVQHFQRGQSVCALLSGGGYAEYVAVPANQVLPLPAGMQLPAAAGICEVFATAYYNLYMLAAAQPGEHILLHAGASAVGQAGLQLAREFGNPTFVTVSSQAKLDHCKGLGAAQGWLRGAGDFTEAVKAWGGADIILDPVVGDYLPANQRVLRQDGRLVVIGLMGGRLAELDAARLLMKRQRLIGSTLRNQPNQVKARIMAALFDHVWPLFEAEKLTANIDSILPVAQVGEAIQRLKHNDTMGKLVLVW